MRSSFRTIGSFVNDIRYEYHVRSSEHSYRRLKYFAHETKNHSQEQTFFAMELMAKRDNESNLTNSIMIDLYLILGNFGRSIVRPSAHYPTAYPLGVSGVNPNIYFNNYSPVQNHGHLFNSSPIIV